MLSRAPCRANLNTQSSNLFFRSIVMTWTSWRRVKESTRQTLNHNSLQWEFRIGSKIEYLFICTLIRAIVDNLHMRRCTSKTAHSAGTAHYANRVPRSKKGPYSDQVPLIAATLIGTWSHACITMGPFQVSRLKRTFWPFCHFPPN